MLFSTILEFLTGFSFIIGSVMFGTTETVFLLVYQTSWLAPVVKL